MRTSTQRGTLLLIFLISFFSDRLLAQTLFSANVLKSAKSESSDNWFANAQKFLDNSSYDFKKAGKSFIVESRSQKLLFEIKGTDIIVIPSVGEIFPRSSVGLKQITKGKSGIILPGPETFLKKDNYIRYDYADFNIEYISSFSGLRENFIIKNKPRGVEDLTVRLAISGDLSASLSDRGSVLLSNRSNKPVLYYDDLIVWDATHKKLEAFMKTTSANEIEIVVKDADAVYPVTVDPLTHSAEWTSSANGVLSNLIPQLQVDAVYGYTVYGLGDINGDGYDDAAIGAPAAAAILPGPVTVAGAGAVFIYFGSASGLPAAPSRTLRSSTPVANALFGYSIASGNVTGTSARDIIIGAPGESYTATVATGIPILPSTTTTVTAGKVYVYDGQIIAGAGPYNSNSIFLDGELYFNNGLAGIVSSNVNVNALFGFSVAASEDMTGDGRSEIIVGAPGYADADILLVRTGAAFVYRSDNIASNTPTRLSSPALTSFPVLSSLNLNGLLFGFSVDGAGDYNKDTRPDVVVGAPGGLSLGLDGFLGGSAYIFSGLANGISTTSTVRLTSSSGVVSSVANLFGYKVKGLKNSAGARTGHIYVGAPVASVLSNVLNGLRLRSGSINIFTAKLSPDANEIPVQAFASPRSTSLLSILSGQNIEASLLFGAAADNIGDADCDGFADLIVGEPLSTGIGLVGVNAVGGAAYILRGKPDGTFFTTPFWTVENSISFDAGVNAGSLLGYSVAGIGTVNGPGNGLRVLIGAPGAALDYSTGILNLGNTAATTFNFAAGDNGLGKAFTYAFNNCSVVPVALSEFDAAPKNCGAALTWKIASESGLSRTDIEESADGIHFTFVKMIMPATNENGNYQVVLPQKNMLAYYRLKLLQSNGSIIYSDIRKVKTGCGNSDVLQAYPTVFHSTVRIVYSSSTAKGKAMLTITDIYGRKIFTAQLNVLAGDNQTTLAGASLAAGVYYAQVSGENYRSETVKIIRQ